MGNWALTKQYQSLYFHRSYSKVFFSKKTVESEEFHNIPCVASSGIQGMQLFV